MDKSLSPLAVECACFMHAATALSGLIALRLAEVDRKKEPVLADRLRIINMEVVNVRAIVRTLRDDITTGELASMAGGGTSTAQGSGTNTKNKPPQGTGEPGDLDT